MISGHMTFFQAKIWAVPGLAVSGSSQYIKGHELKRLDVALRGHLASMLPVAGHLPRGTGAVRRRAPLSPHQLCGIWGQALYRLPWYHCLQVCLRNTVRLRYDMVPGGRSPRCPQPSRSRRGSWCRWAWRYCSGALRHGRYMHPSTSGHAGIHLKPLLKLDLCPRCLIRSGPAL